MKKNHKKRINWYIQHKNDFCNLTLKDIKIILNRIGKYDPLALLYRYLIEADEYNIKAKINDTKMSIRNKMYFKKLEYINKAVDICKENGYRYGIQKAIGDDISKYAYIIYFALDMTHISFHLRNEDVDIYNYPIYDTKIRCRKKTNIQLLETLIYNKYRYEINKKINFRDITIKPIEFSVNIVNEPKQQTIDEDLYNSYIQSSIYKKMIELLSTGKYHDYFIKVRYNFLHGKYKVYKSDHRFDIVLDKNNTVNFYKNSIKIPDGSNYTYISVTKIAFLGTDQKICTEEAYKEYRDSLIRKETNLNKVNKPKSNFKTIFIDKWKEISAVLFAQENKNKYVPIIMSEHGIFKTNEHRYYIMVDSDYKPLLYDFPPQKLIVGDFCIKVSDVDVDNNALSKIQIQNL